MKKVSKKVGLLGGSFNPIHNFHLLIIKTLLNRGVVDEVWIVPCKKHAIKGVLPSAKHRVNMIKLGIKGFSDVFISYVELNSKKTNYTLRTVKILKKRFNHEFFWIAGSDILYEFKKWHNYKELFSLIKFIFFKRTGYPIKPVLNLDYLLVDCPASNISSTIVRKRACLGKSLNNLVPKSVEEYIFKNKLYID